MREQNDQAVCPHERRQWINKYYIAYRTPQGTKNENSGKDRVIGWSLLNGVKEALSKEVSNGDIIDKKESALLGKFIPGQMNRKDLGTYENLKKF